MEKYEQLKKLEVAGISSLVCSIVDFRKVMEETIRNDLFRYPGRTEGRHDQ